MKLAIFSTVILLSVTLAVLADPKKLDSKQPILLVTENSYYLLSLTNPPKIEKLENVIKIDTPDNPPTNDLTSKVKKWTKEINDPTTARALSNIYKIVREKVEKNELSHTKAFDTIKLATDFLLKETNGEAKWKPWRSNVTNELVNLAQAGNLQSKEQILKTITEIEQGLVTQNAAINWERLLELIKLIIQFIETLG